MSYGRRPPPASILSIGTRPLLRSVKADVQVLVDHYSANEQPSFSFPQIGPALKNLAVQGMTLEIEELYALGLWAKEFDRLVASLARVKFSADREASNRTDAAGSVAAAGATAAVAVKAAETVTSADLSDDGTDFDPQALADLWADFRVTKVLGDSPKLQDVYKIVFGVVTPDGELRDLPEVRRIKDSIAVRTGIFSARPIPTGTIRIFDSPYSRRADAEGREDCPRGQG